MKEKLLKTMRVLLVAVLLGVGVNGAWAQTSTFASDKNATYTCGQVLKNGSTDILNFALGGLSGTDTWSPNGGNKGLKTGTAAVITDGAFVSGTYYVVTPTKKLKLDLNFYIPGGNTYLYVDKAGSIGTHLYSYRRPSGSSTSNWQSLSCTELLAGQTYYIYANYDGTGINSFTATTIENYTIHYQDGNGTTIKEDVVYSGLYGAEVTASEKDRAPIEYNDLTYAYNSGNEAITLGTGTNEITLVYSKASVADVTLKYEDTNGNSLSSYQGDQVLSDVVVGTSISSLITSTYTATFYNGESNKYIYADTYTVTGDYTTVQAGGNTVTLKFTNYPATAYTVKAQVSGSDIKTLATGTAFLDGSTTRYFSKYVSDDEGNWYVKSSAPYGVAITSATTNVAFEASDITYFVEGEGMNGYNAASTASGTEYSGGVTGRPYKNSIWYTDGVEVGGLYTISFPYKLIANSSASVLSGLYVRASNGTTALIEENVSLSSNTTYTKTNVAIPAGSSFQISKGDNNSNYGIDYVTLKLTAVAASIGEYGYATFSSTYPVDCANLPDGLTAYKATSCDGSTVTMEEVNTVVAGMDGVNHTGLVLVGTPNTTYYIPVATTSGSEPSGNLLFGWDSSWGNLGVAGSGTNFVLSVQSGDVVWAPIKSDAAPLATGQAGLWSEVTISGARGLSMVFENEITGISEAAVVVQQDGKFIENGKIVIVKNGKKYNANGQLVK